MSGHKQRQGPAPALGGGAQPAPTQYSAVPELVPKSGAKPYKTTTLDALASGARPYRVSEPWEFGGTGEKAETLPAAVANLGGAAKRSAVDAARPDDRKAWHADMAANADFVARPMGADYVGEETLQEAGGLERRLGAYTATGTHYANTKDEYGTNIAGGLSQHGKTVNSADHATVVDGKAVETPGNKFLYRKDKDERVNYAMDAAGEFYTTDPRTETLRRRDMDAKTVERVNHTSLLGGADAAAAGSLKVRDGQVENLDDGSGHYKPAIAQTEQAVSTLVRSGAMDPARSSVTLVGKGHDQAPLDISTTELLAYSDAMAADRAAFAAGADPKVLGAQEATIRERHAKKGAMLQELKRTVGAAPDIETERVWAEEDAAEAARDAAIAEANARAAASVAEAPAPGAADGRYKYGVDASTLSSATEGKYRIVD